MWNMISGNRLIDRKRKESAQKKHLLALNNVKSQVDNSAPKEYVFLYTRPKANLTKQERLLNIQNSNNILVNKMMKSPSCLTSKTDTFFKDSLHSAYRTRKERQIDDGNQKLVKKLQNAKSIYSCAVQYNRDFQRYKGNIANSRMDPFYDFDSQMIAPRKGTRPYSAKR